MQAVNTRPLLNPQPAVNKDSKTKKLFVVAGAVMLLAGAAIAVLSAYTYYQNGKIQSIDCDQGFLYYQDAANKYWASASDKYCLAKKHEIGDGTKKCLSSARLWYKKAYSEGLAIAKDALCRPLMFVGASPLIRHQYRPICCPELSHSDMRSYLGYSYASTCFPPRCKSMGEKPFIVGNGGC